MCSNQEAAHSRRDKTAPLVRPATVGQEMELTLELPDIGLVQVALRHMNAKYNVSELSLSASDYNGDFIDTESGTIGFFVLNGVFFLLVDRRCYRPGLNLVVTNEEIGQERIMKISYNDVAIFEHRYESVIWGVNPFEEEEDFDPLLWLANLANSPERQAIETQTRKSN